MKIITTTVRYGEKRSMQYQSVDVAAEVTITLDEGEDLGKAVAAVVLGLQKRIAPQADQYLGELLADMEAKHGSSR